MGKSISINTNVSPLRYPGGKSRLSGFVSSIIEKTGIEKPIYIEPFSGGAGVALSLLLSDCVNEIVINDFDKAVYSFWRAILTETKRFLKKIDEIDVTIDEWRKQKSIYCTQNNRYSFELGFATFFLNRTNRSGILRAGPIGGYEQSGNYKIDARFNKTKLIEKINRIAKYKHRIHVYNQDIRTFVRKNLKRYSEKAFVYFDPPYYQKGKCLYKNFFEKKDHQEIHDLIVSIKVPWIVTYDNTNEIKTIYAEQTKWLFDITYSVANSGKNEELLFVSDDSLLVGNRFSKEIKLRKE